MLIGKEKTFLEFFVMCVDANLNVFMGKGDKSWFETLNYEVGHQ